MRQDASTIEQQMNHPADMETIGSTYSAYGDVARACEKWLKKRFPDYVPGFGRGNGGLYNRNKPELNAESASKEKGAIKVPRDKVKRIHKKRQSRAMFATKEERAAHMLQKTREYWARPDIVAAKKKRLEERAALRTPRHQTEKWKEYKKAWNEANKGKRGLTEEQKEHNRKMRRARYALQDPVIAKQKRKIKRDRYKAKHKK